jgi:hypothetical protein
MKGIYLTQEGKQVIEDRILELNKLMKLLQRTANENKEFDVMKDTAYASYRREKQILEQILSCATILHSEESWELADEKSDYGLSSKEFYPNGVIIQPKS